MYENQRRPSYGPFYNMFGSHKRVEDFMGHFIWVGQREAESIQVGEEYDKLRSLYDFWMTRRFLTKKQINFAAELIDKISDHCW